MDRLLLSVVSLALLASATEVLAWQEPERYHAPYYSGRYYSGDRQFYRERQPYGYRQGVSQRPGIRIQKAGDADGYLLRIHTRGMSPEDITVSTERGRIRLETATLAWRNSPNARASTYGRFSRTLPLPRDADVSALETRVTDGMLEIRIPRR
jgi:HSP20 family molecular chaperone IbpA